MPALVVLYQAVMAAAYRRDRIEAFLNPWSDPRGSGYQIIQSLIAVGTGGVTGVGLMEGRQKLFYLPYPYSDFIYAVIGEELGLLGAVAVVLAFVLFLWRGLRAAWRAPDAFGTLPGRRPDARHRAAGVHQPRAWCSACCPPRASRCRSSARAARRSSSPCSAWG